MESGAYSRGKEPITAHASMVFEGNLDLDVQIALRTSHLFCPFPARVGNDRAFLDRFHCYLPGWEIPSYADLDVRGFLWIYRRLLGWGLSGTEGPVTCHRN